MSPAESIWNIASVTGRRTSRFRRTSSIFKCRQAWLLSMARRSPNRLSEFLACQSHSSQMFRVFEGDLRLESGLMMRRPDQLTGMRISLGRRLTEPESCVSSSCVGDQFPEPNKLTSSPVLYKKETPNGKDRVWSPAMRQNRPARQHPAARYRRKRIGVDVQGAWPAPPFNGALSCVLLLTGNS